MKPKIFLIHESGEEQLIATFEGSNVDALDSAALLQAKLMPDDTKYYVVDLNPKEHVADYPKNARRVMPGRMVYHYQ